MIFIRNTDTKEKDKRPLPGAFLERKGIGPVRKNLDIPNELASKLKVNVITGSASLKLLHI